MYIGAGIAQSVLSWTTDGSEFKYQYGDAFYFRHTSSRPALGLAQPSVQRATGALTPVVKWPGCTDGHRQPVPRSR
jgi:hypothetical protein